MNIIFQGRIDLDDFNELLGTHLTKEMPTRWAAIIYRKIGRVPTGGEELEVEDWVLTVEQVSGRRIRKVRAHRQSRGDTAMRRKRMTLNNEMRQTTGRSGASGARDGRMRRIRSMRSARRC